MLTLNDWVILRENLKKFDVISEIGEGAQAKVCKISRISKSGEERVYAIKVIKTGRLKDWEGKEDRDLLIKEVRTQRALNLCGNSLKLFKIYETDKFLNMLIEY